MSLFRRFGGALFSDYFRFTIANLSIEPVARSIALTNALTGDRLVLKDLPHSPNYIDGILNNVAIDADDGDIFDLALGDE